MSELSTTNCLRLYTIKHFKLPIELNEVIKAFVFYDATTSKAIRCKYIVSNLISNTPWSMKGYDYRNIEKICFNYVYFFWIKDITPQIQTTFCLFCGNYCFDENFNETSKPNALCFCN